MSGIKTNCSGPLVLKEPKSRPRTITLPSPGGKTLPPSFIKTSLGERSIWKLLVSPSVPLGCLIPPVVGMDLGRLLGLLPASFSLKYLHPGVSKSLARVCCVERFNYFPDPQLPNVLLPKMDLSLQSKFHAGSPSTITSPTPQE